VRDAAGNDASDSSTSDASDASIADGQCSWEATFETIAPITGLAGGQEMRLSSDELTAYLYENSEIYVTQRSSLGAPFAPPTPETDVNSGSYNADPFLSFDGLSFYLNSQRNGTLGGSDIFVAQRATVTSSFAPAMDVANVNSPSYDGCPYLIDDGSELWLGTDRAGSLDIYVAPASGGGFSVAESVAGLNLPTSDENNPVLTADGLTVYYASNRSGATSVYVAHRSSLTTAFSAPALVPELSTNAPSYPSWISTDGCRLYMTNGSPAGLYVATRP
jgi:hypothetical protein